MNITGNISGISSDESTSELERKAIEQRRQLHSSVLELSSQVRATVRETLDVERYAREYVKPAAAVAFLLSFLIGIGVAGTLKPLVR